MRDVINVLIVDDNSDFTGLLYECINNENDMNAVGVADDGLKALELIKELEPDIVLLDIIMPNLDGIGVLERIHKYMPQVKTTFIMLTAVGQEGFIQKAIELGAEYYMVKPFDVNVLLARIRYIFKEKDAMYFTDTSAFFSQNTSVSILNEGEDELDMLISGLLLQVGIPHHMKGYRYIKEAIIQSLDSHKGIFSVTKVLYPSISRKFDTTPQKVERAIRNAIENSWDKGKSEVLSSLFGYRIRSREDRPTNSEFIAVMVDKIRMFIEEKERSGKVQMV